ncbi:MAG: transporter substrate-binding domain-containing protein [Pseudomonadota bacterium]|nr:transporter substrate-binding domain-containing protein [Pseudomonadota bacterium]
MSFFLLFLSQLVYADIIPEIKARGYLNCGVTTGLPGFSYMNDNGQWSGFEVDYCRGIAVAIFNDPQKVKFIALSNQMQFLALNMKQVDVLARVISINYTRSTQLSGLFPVTHYIDDEAVLTYRLNINQLSELDNKTICVVSGSTAEQNLYRYATNHGWSYKPLVMSRGQLAVRALASGRCRAMVGDRSSLYVFKKELPKPELVNISDESIGLEPLGLMIRENDIDLYRLIQWMHYTLVAAEANEITKDILVNGQLSLQSFNEKLNISQSTFKQLQENWMYHLIVNIGNYGEIFVTNLTKPLGIPRSMNNLITNGGLMYAPSLN